MRSGGKMPRRLPHVWKLGLTGFFCGVCVAVELGMTHVAGIDRSQLLLLPEAVVDYIGAENPARLIDAFVAGLAIAGAFGGIGEIFTVEIG
jgi:hypothetical protein